MKALKFLFTTLACLVYLTVFSQPVNDNCADAISLTVGQECTPADYTSITATSEATTVADDPSCGFYQGGDVWFSFTVPTSGDFRIETGSYWALYTGSCGGFTEVHCDNSNQNFREPALSGQTLYIRVFSFNSAQGQNFTLCVWEPDMQPNDYCADAIAISVGQECTPQDYSSQYATGEATSVADNPGCGFYSGGDVWFTFNVPASGDFRIEADTYWALYTGQCGSFSEFHCDNGNQNFREPSLAGQTLYLRAFRFNGEQGEDFSLCVWEPDMQPNDYCADAIAISVGQECTPQDYSSQYATGEATSVADDPGCGFYKGGDVWFTFNVPASGDFRIEADTYWALYTGQCGSFSEIFCDNGNQNFREPSLAGQTLYLRAFRFNSDQGEDFSLCVWEPEMQPNDYCADAIPLSVGQVCTPQDYSSQYATGEATSVADDPGCGFYKGGDVWFTFTVPTSGDFRIEAGTYWTIYSGSCGNFTELHCNSGNMNFSNPAWAGQTFYLRAFRFNGEQGEDFSLCIWETDVPENNLCANATTIILNDSCNAQSFTSRYSTAEEISVAEDPSCGFYKGGDVWFTFTAPESGQFALERTANSNGGNAQFMFYTGSCGAFEEYDCSGDAEINFNDPLIGGEQLYLRVYSFNNRQGSDFDFCIKNTTIAENDNCANATALTVGQECSFETFNNFNTTEEEGIAPTPTCGFYQGGDVWFTFEVPATGQFQINRSNISGGTFNYAIYTGTCGSFSEYDCSNDPIQSLYDAPELAGQTVYLRVFRYNSAYGGEFELCVVAGDCSGTLGGTAFIDECGTCVGGNTGLEACIQDCNGVYGGTAYLDSCDICVGGSTGLDPCLEDCNGDFGGSAFIDDCDQCVGGNTGLEPCDYDCIVLEANIGDSCDDGDPDTENDTINSDCDCVGSMVYDCPALEANIGDSCDDGYPETENDTVNSDCGCIGSIVYDCPVLEANIGDSCDDGDPDTENDTVNSECDCVGSMVYDCPALEANIGDSCDDGDPDTENDTINSDCDCVGAMVYDCPALEANIGDSCDDGNPDTENDTVNSDCDCVGLPIEPSDCEQFVYYLADYISGQGTSIYEVTLHETTHDAELQFLTQIDDEVALAYNAASNLIYGVSKTMNAYYTLNPHVAHPIFTGPLFLDGNYGQVTGAAFSANGELLISSQDMDVIFKIDVYNSTVVVFDAYAPIRGGDIAFNSTGNLFLNANIGSGAALYEVIPEAIAADVFIANLSGSNTGMAITGSDQLILSVKGNTFLPRIETDGLSAGQFALTLNGNAFTLNYGDLTSGCNTYHEPEPETCSAMRTFYAHKEPGVNETVIYEVEFSGSEANLTELTTVEDEVHIGYDPIAEKLHLVSKTGSYTQQYDVNLNSFEPPLAFSTPLYSITGADFSVDDQNVYVADASTNMVYSVDPATGMVANYAAADVYGGDVAMPATMSPYLATQSGNALYRVNPDSTTGFVGSIPSKVTGLTQAANAEGLILSNFNSDVFVEINANDATTITAYTAKLNGDVFTLKYGDMASGCSADNSGKSQPKAFSSDSDNSALETEESKIVFSAYPNPTQGATVVEFQPDRTEYIRVEVYDLTGRNVATLFDSQAEKGQPYRLNFDGRSLPNGVYIYKLSGQNETLIEKFIIAK